MFISAIIAHYAFKGVEQAQQTLLAMNAIGLRTYLQKQLGWNPQTELPKPQASYSEFENRLTAIEQHLTTPQYKSLPKASVDPIPGAIQPLTERQCITRLIRSYVYRHNTTQLGERKTEQDITRWMYRELKYRHGFDAYARIKNSQHKNKIDLIEAEGYLPQLHAICNHFLAPSF